MAQRTVVVPEIGEVTITKRRGAKYLRLSINASGKIRVGMPVWAPYAAAINFVKQRQGWINQQLASKPPVRLVENAVVGKAHRLHFYPAKTSAAVTAKLTVTAVEIFSNLPIDSVLVQKKASAMSEKALQKESKVLLPQRLSVLAKKHGYSYSEVRIRKLVSRWGSCSSSGVINLSYYLIQLPWRLIDYVLLHELVHTRHLNHSTEFWRELTAALPDAKDLQKQIKAHNPRVEVG